DQHQELDVLAGSIGAGALRSIAEHHRDLGFEVETEARIREQEGLTRPKKRAATSLVDERIGLERRWRRGAAGLAHQAHVLEVGGAVDPLIGARQWGAELLAAELEARLVAGL